MKLKIPHFITLTISILLLLLLSPFASSHQEINEEDIETSNADSSIILDIFSTGETAGVFIDVRCENGEMSQNAKSPCLDSSSSNDITEFIVMMTCGGATKSQTIPISASECFLMTTNAPNSKKSVKCVAPFIFFAFDGFDDSLAQSKCNVKLKTVFSDQTSTDSDYGYTFNRKGVIATYKRLSELYAIPSRTEAKSPPKQFCNDTAHIVVHLFGQDSNSHSTTKEPTKTEADEYSAVSSTSYSYSYSLKDIQNSVLSQGLKYNVTIVNSVFNVNSVSVPDKFVDGALPSKLTLFLTTVATFSPGIKIVLRVHTNSGSGNGILGDKSGSWIDEIGQCARENLNSNSNGSGNGNGTGPIHVLFSNVLEPSMSAEDVAAVNIVNDKLVNVSNQYGISFLVPSGEQGASNGQCGVASSPLFPATSPAVLSVGCTMLNGYEITNKMESAKFGGMDYSPHIDGKSESEVVCSLTNGGKITSGGGFSRHFNVPDYQKSVVGNYTAGLTLPSTFYNALGRAYPDVSAVCDNYPVVVESIGYIIV